MVGAVSTTVERPEGLPTLPAHDGPVDRDLVEAVERDRPPDPWLRVELEGDGPVCTLILAGALCGSSIAALEAQVDQLGCRRCEDVVVDVAGLVLLDDVGARVLVGLRHYVSGRGGHLVVTGAQGQVAFTLRRFEDPEHPAAEETPGGG